MLVEVRKNVYVNPAHVVSVFFDPDAGKLVIQTLVNHHAFPLQEGEMPEPAVARVVELLDASPKMEVKVRGVRKPKPLEQPKPLAY